MTWAGCVGALIAFTLALTPSLLPRPGLYLGLIAGLSASFGYLGGVIGRWFLRKVGVPELSEPAKQLAWKSLVIGGPIVLAIALIAGALWQRHVDVLVGEEPASAGLVLALVVAIIVFTLGMLVGRGVRGLTRLINRGFAKFLPLWLARVIGVLIVAFLLNWLLTGVLFNTFINVADKIYVQSNKGTAEGAYQPTTPLRSGSEASLAAWSTLGLQGRTFVGTGPKPADIEKFTGKPAMQPIRVYVGVDTAPTAHDRAALAVRELERTGAFDRKVLVVAGATGTGWIEPQAADSIEYMWGGDTAIATIQYSYLPSWISFLVDKDRAGEAGRALFDAVHAKWLTLPPNHRPKLIVYGLSLGSFAAQAPFTSAQDMAANTDGALFIGTPNFTEPWGSISKGRDAGSPEWQPVINNGQIVRFESSPDDAAKLGPWSAPRVLYAQHASDPVVWWSPKLLLQRPDWLKEPRGPDVSTSMHWFPIVTFFQVTVDQFFGTVVPQGHGHNYASQMVQAWSYVVPPPGWTPADTARLEPIIGP